MISFTGTLWMRLSSGMKSLRAEFPTHVKPKIHLSFMDLPTNERFHIHISIVKNTKSGGKGREATNLPQITDKSVKYGITMDDVPDPFHSQSFNEIRQISNAKPSQVMRRGDFVPRYPMMLRAIQRFSP
jgi:hypothetical protein